MKILIIGKNGQLGWELQQSLASAGNVIAWGREELDIADYGKIKQKLLELQPKVIINAAAYTQVDQAESESELATAINSTAPGILAETARQLHAVFIHYSTDYVFDGQANRPYIETDQTNPLNVYGASKLAGEKNIADVGEAYLIFRTSWVYSLRGDSFVNKVLSWARKNKTLKIVSDQIGCPTWAGMLAQATGNVLEQYRGEPLEALRERRGIYHVAGAGFTSRYEWAKQILACDPHPTEQLVQAIEPVLTVEFPTPAQRPLFSALNCSKFKLVFEQQLPTWYTALEFAMRRK